MSNYNYDQFYISEHLLYLLSVFKSCKLDLVNGLQVVYKLCWVASYDLFSTSLIGQLNNAFADISLDFILEIFKKTLVFGLPPKVCFPAICDRTLYLKSTIYQIAAMSCLNKRNTGCWKEIDIDIEIIDIDCTAIRSIRSKDVSV